VAVLIEFVHVRKGNVIVEDGQLQYVVDRDLNTPGNWKAILKLKLKNLKTGNVLTKSFHPEHKVELAILDKREMEYIYQDGDGYVFMDTETSEQTTLGRDWVADQMLFMKENMKAHVVFYDGNPISLELPAQVELTVAETEPMVKSSGSGVQYKPAVMETGLKISVPPFIVIGEVLAIDTREGKYLNRVK